MPGDGKSTTVANLAITLVHQRLRVLLIDADMRRGSLNRLFHVAREPGLSNVLIGVNTVEEAVRKVQVSGADSLSFMPSGIFPPNAAELISSGRMDALIARLRAEYDIVLFDSPPLNLVTDASLLGARADGVVLIGRANHTEKAALAFAAEQLAHVRAPLLGSVLNDFDFSRDGRYGVYGSYGYHSAAYASYYGSDVDELPEAKKSTPSA
jgi:capsular exopolysaccharide synthesis family protein